MNQFETTALVAFIENIESQCRSLKMMIATLSNVNIQQKSHKIERNEDFTPTHSLNDSEDLDLQTMINEARESELRRMASEAEKHAMKMMQDVVNEVEVE